MTNFQFSLLKGSGQRTPETAKASSNRPLLRLSKTPPLSRSKTDLRGGEGLNQAKLNAAKIVQKQTPFKNATEKPALKQISIKNDAILANAQVRKSADQVRTLEVKVQQVSSENSKLRKRHREDMEIWKGLQFKLATTTEFSDHLKQTLQHLADQVEEMEGNKSSLEEKLVEQMKVFEELTLKVGFLTSKLDSTESKLDEREQELKMLSIRKDELEESYDVEVSKSKILVVSKDNIEKQLKDTIEEDSRLLENLRARLDESLKELSFKAVTCTSLQEMQSRLEKDKNKLDIQIKDYQNKLSAIGSEKDALEEKITCLSNTIIELGKLSLVTSENMDQLFLKLDRSNELAQIQYSLADQKTQAEISCLKNQLQQVNSTKSDLETEVQESKNEILELKQNLETISRTSAEKEADAALELELMKQRLSESSLSNDKKQEALKKLRDNIAVFSQRIHQIQKDKDDLILAVGNLKKEHQNAYDNAWALLGQKVGSLENELAEKKRTIQKQEKELDNVHDELRGKNLLVVQLQERGKGLEEHDAEVSAQLAMAQQSVADIRSQCELQLEAKQLELSRHLKEISQRNDQEISDIRRRCEAETRESIIKEKEREKEKADALLAEAKRKLEEKIAEMKEETLRSLKQVQADHEIVVKRLQDKIDKEKSVIRDYYSEEMKRKNVQTESDFKEQLARLTRDSEARIGDLKKKHQEEIKKLQDEHNKQKQQTEGKQQSLEMQLSVLKEKLQEEIKRRDNDIAEAVQKAAVSLSKEAASQSNHAKPISMVKKTNVDKITKHEYEVSTSDGKKTIRKRKSTRSTVMFGGSAEEISSKTGKANEKKRTDRQAKRMKIPRATASPIGDLFGGRSLDPYVDDPYAF